MAEKPCGLIVQVPFELQEAWARMLPQLLARFRPAALLLLPPFELAQSVVEAGRATDLAVLLHSDLARAESLGAGLYETGDPQDVAKARSALGTAAIVGALCSLSRHDAMEKAEAGADFIAFEARTEADCEDLCELAGWWDEVTEIPFAIAVPIEKAPSLWKDARADFLILQETASAGESLTFATELGLQSQN